MALRRAATAGSAGWKADWGVTVGWVRRVHAAGAGPLLAPAPRPGHPRGLAAWGTGLGAAVCSPALLRLSRRLYTTTDIDDTGDADETATGDTPDVPDPTSTRPSESCEVEADTTEVVEAAVPAVSKGVLGLAPEDRVGLIAVPIQPESPKLLKVAVVSSRVSRPDRVVSAPARIRPVCWSNETPPVPSALLAPPHTHTPTGPAAQPHAPHALPYALLDRAAQRWEVDVDEPAGRAQGLDHLSQSAGRYLQATSEHSIVGLALPCSRDGTLCHSMATVAPAAPAAPAMCRRPPLL